MKAPAFLRGLVPVGWHEFYVNLRSVRMLIMIIVLALIMVGGAYGIGRGSSAGGPSIAPLVAWVHPAIGTSGEHIAVAWVSDPFGVPLSGATVSFTDLSVQPPAPLFAPRRESPPLPPMSPTQRDAAAARSCHPPHDAIRTGCQHGCASIRASES